MRPPATHPPLEGLVRRHYAALRRALVLREGLRAAAGIALAIAAAVALGAAWSFGEAAAWARLALTLLAAVALLAGAVGAFRRARPGPDGYLERVEERFPAVRSWLRNALDFERHRPEHTSAELAAALGAETARRLESVPLDELKPRLEPRRPLAAIAGALVVIAVLGAALPARTGRSWRALLDPRVAAPPVRLEVEPGSVTVSPGTALAVRARVWGTAARPRFLADGTGRVDATREGEGPRGERLWRFDLNQLTRAFDYRVRVAAVESPRYRVALAGTPQPVSFEIEVRPPAYARLPVQRGAATRGDLAALRGSRASIEVLFDRDLAGLDAVVDGAAAEPWRAVNPRRWRGAIEIGRAAGYELRARAAEGVGRFRYAIQALADAPPVLTVRVPQGDLDLPEGQQIAYDVLGQDDLGLTALELEVRKGADRPWTRRTLARFADRPRETGVAARWDASLLGLLPGETASFRFLLLDDDAIGGPNVTASPTYELRFPSLAELYQSLDQSHETVETSLEQVSDRAQELQKSLDKLARQAPSPASGNPRGFEQREEVKSALDRQEELSKRIDEAARQLRESLSQAAERKAFDEQLTAKLRELAQVMDQIQSPEFKDAMRRLREALENAQPRTPPTAMQDWRRQNEQMLKNVERTLELLKRLRQEERLQALAQRANDLKAAQDDRNRRLEESAAAKRADAERQKALADEQRRAAEETEQLAKDAQALANEMKDAAQALQQAAQELEQEAAPAQRQGAEQMDQPRSQQAQRSGQRASQSLQRASDQLSSISQAVQQQRQQVDLATLRRSAQDLVSIQREADSNLGSGALPQDRGDRQTDLAEGAARVADSLWALSKKTPFVSPRLAQSLGRAIQGLQQSGKQFGLGDRPGGESAGRTAATALVEAVLQLRQTENSMCQNPGTGPPKEGSTPTQMDQIGRQQGQLNDQTRTLSQRLSEQARLTAGDQEELRRMAGDQARLRQELERIESEERERQRLLGRLGGTVDEMKQVEEALEQGRLGDEVQQKQEHILSRLLDAQRSVNRQDFDPQRESRPGVDVARPSPAAIPADLLGGKDRLRMDLLKSEADRYPAQYRAFIEAYLRALNAGGGSK